MKFQRIIKISKILKKECDKKMLVFCRFPCRSCDLPIMAAKGFKCFGKLEKW